MTRIMTGQPENVDKLQTANQKAQTEEHEALENAGVTRSEIMEIVETFDQYGATGTAWYEAGENGVRVKATVTARDSFDAMDEAVIEDEFDAALVLNENNDDVLVLEVGAGEEETHVVDASDENIESLEVGDTVTINHTGEKMDGGSYTVKDKKEEYSLIIEDENGNEGWMVRTYGGESRVHVPQTGITRKFSLMQVE